MATLKVAILVCCLVWVCEATTAEEGKVKHTPVAVAVALAEEAGTVEDADRDKRFNPFLPPSYLFDITPEEWEAARRWMESRFRDDPTLIDTPGSPTRDAFDRQFPRGLPPPPPWYFGDYHPYQSYLRWFRGPHSYTEWGNPEGYCSFPYPHSHPFRSGGHRDSERDHEFRPSDDRGEGLGYDRNQQGFGGIERDRNQQGFGGIERDRNQQGFGGIERDRNQQGFGGIERDRNQQGFGGNERDRNQQGFGGIERDRNQQGFGGIERDRNQQGFGGIERDRNQQGFGGIERDRNQQGFGGIERDKNQQRFEDDRNFQVNEKPQQEPGRDRINQGFSQDRGTEFLGTERDQGRLPGNGRQGFGGIERDRNQQGFGGIERDRNQQRFEDDRNFQVNEKPQQGPGRDRINQGFSQDRGTEFSGTERDQGRLPGNGRQGFSSQQGFVRSQQDIPSSRDQSPTFGSFPQSDRPSQSDQFGADNFPLSGQDGVRISSQGTRGGEPFSMGTGNSPLSSGGGPPFSTPTNRGPFNAGGNIAGGSTSIGSGAPNSFIAGGSNNFGTTGSFDGNIPPSFGPGSPDSDSPTRFNAGAPTGSNTNTVSLSSSSSSSTSGDPLASFPGSSPLGGSANLRGPGSTSSGFSGFGSNVQNRNPQKSVLDAKNNIKRETEAVVSSSVSP